MQAINYTDGYKTGHREQYPKGTNVVYSNFTPRSDKYASGSDGEGVVVVGIQYMIQKYIIDTFQDEFFMIEKERAVINMKRIMKSYLFKDVDATHIERLHDLGYIPVTIKALPEGSLCPIGVPCLTIVNELPEFFWLTNFLETLISATLWQPMTNATTARLYRKIMEKFAEKTGSPKDFIPFQCHDFSFRGMPGVEAASASGFAHLTSFVGTDTIPAIDFAEEYYGADADNELIGCTVPATEHSVMCMGTMDDEIGTFRRLINEIYPSGIVSIVSDTWDFWKVVTEYLPALKDEIMARDGKVVIRPDSGDPADILCGKPLAHCLTVAESQGLIECLWDTFGGTVNDAGYKVLDSHIGAIYGDSITLERAEDILSRLEAKGFASCNVVFGIGSYTYQYNTRDTYGFAMKATYGEVNGEGREIFKDPATDKDKTKKSAKGLLSVGKSQSGKYGLLDCCTWEEEKSGELKTVYEQGEIVSITTLAEIRDRVNQSLKTA